jgi:hypothetical protein
VEDPRKYIRIADGIRKQNWPGRSPDGAGEVR